MKHKHEAVAFGLKFDVRLCIGCEVLRGLELLHTGEFGKRSLAVASLATLPQRTGVDLSYCQLVQGLLSSS